MFCFRDKLIGLIAKQQNDQSSQVYSRCVYVFGQYQHYDLMQLIAVTDNPRHFTIREMLHKNQIHISRHLLSGTLEIIYSTTEILQC